MGLLPDSYMHKLRTNEHKNVKSLYDLVKIGQKSREETRTNNQTTKQTDSKLKL